MSLVSIALAIVACTVATWVWWSKRRKMRGPFEGIPCAPDPHWLLGHLPILGALNFSKAFEKLAADPTNSTGIVSLWLVNDPGICVTRGREIKMLLSMTSVRLINPLIRRHYQRILGKNSLLVINGKFWKLYRSVMHRAFSPTAIKEFQSSINHVSSTMESSLHRRIEESPDKHVKMDALVLLRMATLDHIGSSAMGVNFRCCENLTTSPAAKAFEFLCLDSTRRIQSPFNPFYQFYSMPTQQNRSNLRERDALRGMLSGIAQNHRNRNNDSPQCDLLTNIINVVENEINKSNEGEKEKARLTDEIVADMLMTLLFAGYDTTSITLAYAVYVISKYPRVQELCVEEAIRTLGTSGVPEEFDPEGKLHYIRAVVYETLRVFPSAPQTSRVLERPVTLHGHTFPVGTKVFIPIWVIHRDPINYPRPEEFLPERWARRKKVNGNEDGAAEEWEERPEDDTYDSEAENYIPPARRDTFVAFSAGARNCLGQRLAMQESVTLLAFLLRSLKFEIEPGFVPQPVRSGPIQIPRDGVPVIIKRR